MVTLDINSNNNKALQIDEIQILEVNRLQKNCQESKNPA